MPGLLADPASDPAVDGSLVAAIVRIAAPGQIGLVLVGGIRMDGARGPVRRRELIVWGAGDAHDSMTPRECGTVLTRTEEKSKARLRRR